MSVMGRSARGRHHPNTPMDWHKLETYGGQALSSIENATDLTMDVPLEGATLVGEVVPNLMVLTRC